MWVVTIPNAPSVATNANASGNPAKFAATPEHVVRILRRNPGGH